MKFITTILLVLFFFQISHSQDEIDPLPSWRNVETKKSIIQFVERVTNESSKDFVMANQRIATFDNDGCLWAEQPVYFQLIFAIDQVKINAAKHPEWNSSEPFKSAIAGDLESLMATGKEGLSKIIKASHSNITSEEFSNNVQDWLKTAKHPTTGKPYNKMVYKPMLELLAYLRKNDFKTYIVSGGGIDFLRVFAEETYGIPPEQVIGSSLSANFEIKDGLPVIIKSSDDLFINDKTGKPVGIYKHIGRRPIFAAGNSDGDLQMLQYTTITSQID